MYKGEVIATAESRDEAERLKGMYQMDYGPEIDIKKDSEMSFDDDYGGEEFDSYNEDDDELVYDEW
jgi:hypothetical protein